MGTNDENCGIPTQRFVLESLDETTECITEEVVFEVDEVAELCTIIDANVADISRFVYELESEQVERLMLRFKIAFDHRSPMVRLRGWRPIDELPYKVHTNRERALMLQGIKPLSIFSGEYPGHPDLEEIPERLFDPYVAAARFVKREYVVPSRGTREVLYALPTQEWRINAMILLLDTAAQTGWNESLERIQGSLLGYETWQNDVFMERIYERGRPSSPVSPNATTRR